MLAGSVWFLEEAQSIRYLVEKSKEFRVETLGSMHVELNTRGTATRCTRHQEVKERVGARSATLGEEV